MRRVAAPLAAVVLGLAVSGCGGDDGAEPGAPEGATLVLDFQPNAVHSGIYAAAQRGLFRNEGVDVTIREPSETGDAPKLLAAGRVDLAVMDINDFGIARERGADIAAVAAIVQRPLASVIAGDRSLIRTPADLTGKSVGVTGVPSDDAVLDTVLRDGGVDPESVRRITIGFNAVSALATGKIAAATAFWSAEGTELRQLGRPTREFRVDRFGAPRYPELVLAVRGEDVASPPEKTGVTCAVLRGLERGYTEMGDDPNAALDDLLDAVPGADRESQSAQLAALVGAQAFSNPGKISATPELNGDAVRDWQGWAKSRGLIDRESIGAVANGFPRGVMAACLLPGG